jgi:hypothetical protein
MKYGISEKVWNAIIGTKNSTLPRIMFAAALDPLLIHDLYDIPEPRSLIECVRLADMGTRGDLRNYLRGVLAEWIMEQDTAQEAIRPIVNWDKRLAVWLAAAAAETALRFVPRGEVIPDAAIQAARKWIFGTITVNDLAAAATAAYSAADVVMDRADAAYAEVYEVSSNEDATADANARAASADAALSAYMSAYASAYAAYYAEIGSAATATTAYAAVRNASAAYLSFVPPVPIDLREYLASAVWTYPLE